MADITLTVVEEQPIGLTYVEAAIKPEQTKDVVPSYEAQTVLPDDGMTLGQVNVAAIPDPTDEININENGDYNVARIGTAHVEVPQGVFPAGTKQISITQNGTTTENVTDYADVEITVNTDPEKGLVFGDYDADGYPHSARFVGEWTSIPWDFLSGTLAGTRNTKFVHFIKHITIPDTVTSFGNSAFMNCENVSEIIMPDNDFYSGINTFRGCYGLHSIEIKRNVRLDTGAFFQCISLENVIFKGEVDKIAADCFALCRSVMLYDFSHCTAIPPLYSVASLGHASGCVIPIPAALSDTTLGTGNGWESATNWSALTDIVWEVV